MAVNYYGARSFLPAVPSVRVSKPFILLLGALTFAAFMTESKFVPGVANNIGLFELTSIVFIVSAIAYFLKNNVKIQIPFPNKILFILIPIAAVSVLRIPEERMMSGVISVLILMFVTIISLAVYNVVSLDEKFLYALIRLFAYSAVIAGVWYIMDGGFSGSYSASGPFRNRVHAGISMLTSFWVVLIFALLPNIPRIEKIAAFSALPIILLGVASAGRRSVYVSLIVGLLLLALSFGVTRGKQRMQIIVSIVLIFSSFYFIYAVVSDYTPGAAFFKERVWMIEQRLTAATMSEDEPEADDNFILLQRQGVLRAFGDYPILGIGWGGFVDSEYSPTGHEAHSMPLRFLGELGLIGISFYLIFMGGLLFGSFRLWRRSRGTDFQLPTLVICIAFWSLSLSYLYNRHFTERTFWLLVVVYLGIETLVAKKLASSKRARRDSLIAGNGRREMEASVLRARHAGL